MNDNLKQRCQELLEWSATGLLNSGSGGALRAYAENLTDIPKEYRLRVAENRTHKEAMEFVINHTTGNNNV